MGNTGYYTDLDSRAIVGDFFYRYEQEYSKVWAPIVSWENPNATQETETYKMLGSSPVMREWLGGRAHEQLNKYSFSITNKLYEATMDFKVADLRRDKTPQIRARIGEQSFKAAEHSNILLSDLINNNNNAYDAVNFFSTVHLNDAGATIDNALVAGTLAALNVASTTAPTAAEMALIITEMIGKMMAWQDDRGQPINGGAREFAFMVHPEVMGGTLTALASNLLQAGNTNPLNAFKQAGNFSIMPIINPRITTATEVFLFRLDGGIKPFITQVEEPLTVQVLGQGSDLEFEEDVHAFGIKKTCASGYGEYKFACRGTLS